jgi:hypothetical protein
LPSKYESDMNVLGGMSFDVDKLRRIMNRIVWLR